MFWPALSARRPPAWIAGPSAIGSVNGMPSSITSAPAFGSAFRIASEVLVSGSPAIVKVTSAARPSRFSVGEALVDAGGHLRERSWDRRSGMVP